MFGIFLKLCLCVHWGVNNEGWWQGTIRLTVLKPCAEWQDHHFSDNRWLHSLILPSCCCPCLVCFRQTLVVGPMSQKCSPTFLSFRHTWRLRSLFVISPWMPPSQQALFAQSLNWLSTEVPPSLPDPWTPADHLPPALHRPLPWMEIKAVLRFPLKRTLRAMRSLLGDCARTLGGPFASMLGGQSLMMVGVASRHCDPHCLGEVLGETLFEATLDPPSPLRSPDTCSGSVWCPPQGGGDQLQHKCGLLWPSLSHHLVTHSCHRWRRRPPTSSLDRSPLVGASRGASRPASQQIVEQAHLRGDQTRPREQTSQPWSSPADRSNRICWFSSAGVCLPVLGKLLLLITWSQGEKKMILFQFFIPCWNRADAKEGEDDERWSSKTPSSQC